MKSVYALIAALFLIGANAFAPSSKFVTKSFPLMAKYNNMDEILDKFPDDKPVLINFYDANTEATIKSDIVRAKKLLDGRCTVVSIKQQDYPELAKQWDAHEKSPSMILFKDGKPATRLYEQTFYLDIVAKVGSFCDDN